MTFNEAYEFADVAYSERFAGIPGKVNWSDDQINMINQT